MSNTIKLKNVSFRVVGNFLRVNQPYTAVPSPAPVPFSFDFEELELSQPPTVGALMNTLRDTFSTYEQDGQKFTFDFHNLESDDPRKSKILDVVEFGPVGATYRLSADEITKKLDMKGPNGEVLGAAWQYYVFEKDEFGRDKRIEVAGRAPYGESVMIRDDMRVIWRLILTYIDPEGAPVKQYLS